MLSLLKPGGTIACEEHDYKAIFNYPYARSIEQYKELLHKIAKRLSVDYSYGILLVNEELKEEKKEARI